MILDRLHQRALFRRSLTILVYACAAAIGCRSNSGSQTPSTPTPPAPVVTESFAGVLAVNGSRFYSFSIASEGAVNARLDEIGGTNVDPAVSVHLGIGTLAGVNCNAGRTLVRVGGGADGVAALVSSNLGPGTHCVLIADAGNLVAPATFRVAIEHP